MKSDDDHGHEIVQLDNIPGTPAYVAGVGAVRQGPGEEFRIGIVFELEGGVYDMRVIKLSEAKELGGKVERAERVIKSVQESN